MTRTMGLIQLTLTCMLVSWRLQSAAEQITLETLCDPGYTPCEQSGFCIPISYLCDDFKDCNDGSDEQGCFSSTSPSYSTSSYTTDVSEHTTDVTQHTTDNTEHTTDNTESPTGVTELQSTTNPGNDCFLPFLSVGDRCVFVDPFVKGSWAEMRYRCQEFGSVLLEVDEPNIFQSVVQLIKDKGLESTSFWTGGRRDAAAAVFYWDGSRTNVTMGTPFWAIYYPCSGCDFNQEPDDSGLEQCVLLNKDRKLFLSDMDCDATLAGVVCQRAPGPVGPPADLTTQYHLDSFFCDHTACVSMSKVCDGVKNCHNNADEAFCHGARSIEGVSTPCADTHFECGNGNCVWMDYVCDGRDDCSDLSDEMNCDATTTRSTSTTPGPATARSAADAAAKISLEVLSTSEIIRDSGLCSPSPPYHSVGGKCIFVEPFGEGSWDQMRYRCEEFGGILLEMEDPNLFLAVVEYIIENGIGSRDYWIGGRKDANDDVYYWDDSRTNVTMGTPFWALLYSAGPYYQEPEESNEERCVFLNKGRKLFLSSTNCDLKIASVICQKLLDQ